MSSVRLPTDTVTFVNAYICGFSKISHICGAEPDPSKSLITCLVTDLIHPEPPVDDTSFTDMPLNRLILWS
jgi:hypothetical protein